MLDWADFKPFRPREERLHVHFKREGMLEQCQFILLLPLVFFVYRILPKEAVTLPKFLFENLSL